MALVACPRCGTGNAEGSHKCAACGAELAMFTETLPASGSAPTGPLEAGESLIGRTIGRYKVEARLGGGGMGVVYRAIDERLRRPVALKVLSPSVAHDAMARERFEREARAASALDHPNIGTIYEIGEQDGRLYMAMALYEGESLRQRITREPMTFEEIERVALQLAGALEVAHAAGIVHRDVKPANVMVLRDGTVKLVDFGLAKRPGEDQALTAAGGVVGTVLYMSPEQVRGREVDHRTDLWALGVVLYEMIAGKVPFSGDSGVATGVQIVEDEARWPQKVEGRVPPSLALLVEGLLKKNPAERIASARDVRRALAGPMTGSGVIPAGEIQTGTRRPARPLRRFRAPAIAGGVLLLVVGGVGWRYARRDRGGSTVAGTVADPPRAPAARRAVAVLGFKNLSGRPDAAWLSTALGEMLATELSAGERLRTIPGENVARMKIELGLTDADTLAKDTLRKVRANVSADLVVLGSYLSVEGGGVKRLRLDLHIQDAADGETIASFAETGTEAEVFDLVSRAGGKLRESLGGREISAEAQASLKTLRPASVGAVKLYAEGLARLRAFDALGARERLDQAIAADPEFALAHSAVAEALAHLGRDAVAAQEAKRAFDLSGGLPREDRLLIEARYRESVHAWQPAFEAYRTLFDLHPDDVERGLHLAEVQFLAGKRNDSLATIALLRKIPPPGGDDPRIDLAEAAAADYIGDHRTVVAAAGRAAKGGEARGMPLCVAQARYREGFAWYNLGDYPKSLAAAEEARRISQSVGDRGGEGLALAVIGSVRRHEGDLTGGAKAFADALAIYRDLGSGRMIAESANDLALHQIALGRFAEARPLLEESVRLSREIGAKDSLAAAMIDQGRLVWLLGDLKAARARFDEAIAILEEIGDQRVKAWALSYLGDLVLEEGDLVQAESIQRRALALREGAGYKKFAAESRLSLAQVAIEKDHPEQAEGPAREIAQLFRELDSRDLTALAELVLARALHALHRREEAGAAIERAVALSGKSEEVEVRARVGITAGRIHADQPARRNEAIQALSGLLDETTRLGFVDLQLEARLALGEAEKLAGRPAVRARLKALALDAAGKGFRLIARKATDGAR